MGPGNFSCFCVVGGRSDRIGSCDVKVWCCSPVSALGPPIFFYFIKLFWAGKIWCQKQQNLRFSPYFLPEALRGQSQKSRTLPLLPTKGKKVAWRPSSRSASSAPPGTTEQGNRGEIIFSVVICHSESHILVRIIDRKSGSLEQILVTSGILKSENMGFW